MARTSLIFAIASLIVLYTYYFQNKDPGPNIDALGGDVRAAGYDLGEVLKGFDTIKANAVPQPVSASADRVQIADIASARRNQTDLSQLEKLVMAADKVDGPNVRPSAKQYQPQTSARLADSALSLSDSTKAEADILDPGALIQTSTQLETTTTSNASDDNKATSDPTESPSSENESVDGLVICSQEPILPLTPISLSRVLVADSSTGSDLNDYLQNLGIEAFIQLNPGGLENFFSTFQVIGWPVAFYDRQVRKNPEGLEIGEVGRKNGLQDSAAHCSLIFEKSVSHTTEGTASEVQDQDLPQQDAGSSEAIERPFQGTTIVALDGNDARIAIAGEYMRNPTPPDWYLVTHVSDRGTYASIASRGERKCIAWSAAGIQENQSITFGIKFDDYEGSPNGTPWCQPFTLHWLGDAKVRLVAQNEVSAFGKKGGPETRLYSHDGTHRIVAWAPTLEPNFENSVYQLNAIHGIKLGPLETVAVKPGGQIAGPRNAPMDGVDFFSARFESFPDQDYGGFVQGEIALASAANLANDTLVTSFSHDQLPQFVEAQSIVDSLAQSLGPPTAGDQIKTSNRAKVVWLYDLSGKLLSPEEGSLRNCLGPLDLWDPYWHTLIGAGDIGPWNCALVTFLKMNFVDIGYEPGPPAKRTYIGQIDNYRVETMAGHALGIAHFSLRMQQLENERARLNLTRASGATDAVEILGAEALLSGASSPPEWSSIDFLRPGGVVIGMSSDEARALLEQEGFDEITPGLFQARYDRGTVRVGFSIVATTSSAVDPKNVVASLSYHLESLDLAESAESLVSHLNEVFGTNSGCSLLNEEIAFCDWQWPPNMPLATNILFSYNSKIVKAARDQGDGFAFDLGIEGVSNLAERLTSNQTNSVPTLGEFDARRPGGIAIGMTIEQANSILDAGKVREWPFCSAHKKIQNVGVIEVSFKTTGTCQAKGLINEISFHARKMKIADSILDFVANISQQLGGEGDCRNLTDQEAFCFWAPPPSLQHVREISIIASKDSFQLSALAAPNMQEVLEETMESPMQTE